MPTQEDTGLEMGGNSPPTPICQVRRLRRRALPRPGCRRWCSWRPSVLELGILLPQPPEPLGRQAAAPARVPWWKEQSELQGAPSSVVPCPSCLQGGTGHGGGGLAVPPWVLLDLRPCSAPGCAVPLSRGLAAGGAPTPAGTQALGNPRQDSGPRVLGGGGPEGLPKEVTLRLRPEMEEPLGRGAGGGPARPG
ncbi:hypothetical protein H1C71_007614 [Ictidomys tridecemlineatus]|nr:hypothetical protein H1C71_007614 [Ictidomys tridecemlineatus]